MSQARIDLTTSKIDPLMPMRYTTMNKLLGRHDDRHDHDDNDYDDRHDRHDNRDDDNDFYDDYIDLHNNCHYHNLH